jgi:hypothetical protein
MKERRWRIERRRGTRNPEDCGDAEAKNPEKRTRKGKMLGIESRTFHFLRRGGGQPDKKSPERYKLVAKRFAKP